MKNKKSLISLFLLIFPLLIVLGFSSWIIIHEVVIVPSEQQIVEQESLAKYFKNADGSLTQSTIYNSQMQSPQQTSGEKIDENLLSYQFCDAGKDNYSDYTDACPTDVGIYDIKISSEGYIPCIVTLTIEKYTPSDVDTPTFVNQFQGETQAHSNTLAGAHAEWGSGTTKLIPGTYIYDTSTAIYEGTNQTSQVQINYTWEPTDKRNYNSVSGKATLNLDAVAYIGNRYFGTIEAALSTAISGETVYVCTYDSIVGVNLKVVGYPIITKNCQVKPGVTLTLPFDGTTYNGRQTESQSTNTWRDDCGANFADSNLTAVNKYLKCSVTLASGITIINNGTINIGGTLGHESAGISGQTSGAYAQLIMEENSKIINNGTIDCLGYIKEKAANNASNIVCNANSNLKMPFVVYDYKGGSITTGLAKNTDNPVLPFSEYDMPNIHARIEFNYRSNLYGYADLYTSETSKSAAGITATIAARHNTCELLLISTTNALLNIKGENSSIITKYTSNNIKYTALLLENGFKHASGKTTISFDGQIDFGYMVLVIEAAKDVSYSTPLAGILQSTVEKMLNASIDTKGFFFPIPYNFDIEINSGSFSINNKIKFLTGSHLTINGQNTNLNINSDVIFYSTFKDANHGGCCYPIREAAKFINNGIVNIPSQAAFGGYIENTDDFAKVIYNSNRTPSSPEGTGGVSISGLDVNFTFTPTEGSPFTENAVGDINNNGAITKKANFVTNSAYIAANQSWILATNCSNFTVKYNTNCDIILEDSKLISTETTYNLNNSDLKIINRDYYNFLGWYKDAALTQPATPYTMNKDEVLLLYAKWEKTTYSFEYSIYIEQTDGSFIIGDYNLADPTSIRISSFTVENFNQDGIFELPKLSSYTHDGQTYYFNSWYLGTPEGKNRTLSSISLNELNSIVNDYTAIASDKISIYCIFTTAQYVNIEFITNNPDVAIPTITGIRQNTYLDSTSKNNINNYLTQFVKYNNDTGFSLYYDVNNWYTDANCTVLFDADEKIVDNVKLYAKGRNKHELNFMEDQIRYVYDSIPESYYVCPNSTLTIDDFPIVTASKIIGNDGDDYKIKTEWNNKWFTGETEITSSYKVPNVDQNGDGTTINITPGINEIKYWKVHIKIGSFSIYDATLKVENGTFIDLGKQNSKTYGENIDVSIYLLDGEMVNFIGKWTSRLSLNSKTLKVDTQTAQLYGSTEKTISHNISKAIEVSIS